MAESRSHPNERYWLLKTICLNNLYGLDIMGEATEIARLRLFLKLIAQLDNISQVEPLPDLDFNIKSGNLLVGIADMDDAQRRFEGSILAIGGLKSAEQAAGQAAAAYRQFAAAQLSQTGAELVVGKHRLSAQIGAATSQADVALHDMRTETQPFELWKESHQPFHWFAEFPSVWQQGGFDVIVGNPPYIRTKLVTDYVWMGYATPECPDLYAVCVERASTLLNSRGRMAMIVMHSLCFGEKYKSLRDYLAEGFASLWISSYSRIPDGLFSAARVRNSIVVTSRYGRSGLNTTRVIRWTAQGRQQLFSSVEYTPVGDALQQCTKDDQWPFTDSEIVTDAFSRTVRNGTKPLGSVLVKQSEWLLGYKKVAQYMLGVFAAPPPSLNPVTMAPVSTRTERFGRLCFPNEVYRDLALMVLTGRWGYLWWMMFGDECDVTRSLLAAVPCDIERMATSSPRDMELVSLVNRILELAQQLKSEMPEHIAFKKNAGVLVGRYNMFKLRHITDEADWLLAQAWGLTREEYDAAGNLRDRMTFGNKG